MPQNRTPAACLTVHHSDALPPGHRARPIAAAALLTSVTGAGAFTVFAYVTTQLHAVRAVSPWQDDPYDTVVTFTMFFVPLLGAITALRALLCRRDQPLPLYRIQQLLRAALAGTLLVAATLATDWTAVAAGADHTSWTSGTPWLVGSLVPLTGLAGAGPLLHRLAVRRLPAPSRHRPDGDWLDDIVPLLHRLLPRPVRRLPDRLRPADRIAFVRRHFPLLALAAGAASGLLVATGLASGEGWPGLALFLVESTVFSGGTFAFVQICDAVLRIAVPPAPGVPHRAAWIAATAGALALPTSLALRDPIWAALGLGHQVDSVGQLAALTLASGLLTGAVAFAAALGATGRAQRSRNA